MSDETPIGPNPCPSCGMEYGEHITGCRNQRSRPPVYDLAEFERQLSERLNALADIDTDAAWIQRSAIGDILFALRVSKREAK